MVSQQTVNEQLKKIGVSFNVWGRNEIKELCKILAPDETIKNCVNGHYLGGFAMLVATDHRLLLVDKKPMFLTIEAIWYEKIGQIDFNHRLLNASVCVSTPNKELNFTTWNSGTLRKILLYTQEKMAETKQIEEGNGRFYADSQVLEYEHEQDLLAQRAEQERFYQLQLKQPTAPKSYKFTNGSKFTRPYDLTLYGATQIPFSRRRYYNRKITQS